MREAFSYSGTPEELASNPDARRKYLGTNFDLRKAVLHDKKDDNGNPIPGTGNEKISQKYNIIADEDKEK